MVKEKYPDLDFFYINFSDMKGHDSADPLASNKAAVVQSVEKVVVEAEGAREEIARGVNENVAPESGENNNGNVVAILSD